MKLILSNETATYIQNHTEATYPNEGCGFFFGTDGDQRMVTHIQKAINAKEGDQRRRFSIDPDDYRRAEQFASDHDLDLLGVYHSHPDHPAEPSEHDREVALPYFSYIIISVREGSAAELRSWRLNEQRQFEEEPVKTEALANSN